jgi:tetratricopeptide (TPR) repeat protein
MSVPPLAIARAACDPEVGTFVSIQGSVQIQRAAGRSWNAATLTSDLCEGDTIRVGDRSRAAVALINEAVLRIDQNSAIRLLDIEKGAEGTSILDMVKGAFQSFSRTPRFLQVSTPYLNGSVEGTEFLARAEDEAAEITVFEGVVRAMNDQGEVTLSPGQSARAMAGQAPQRRTLVRPRDQVEWALYYPPVFSAAAISGGAPALQGAAACAAQGDMSCAFAAMDKVPGSSRDAQFLLLRASLLLSVGRVEEARTDIDQALVRDPGAGQAYALRSVIAVAQNETDQALVDARRGIELNPDSAAAKVALSYALQSSFQIEQARETMTSAVEQNPDDALAWARLGELELMLGSRNAALAAARKGKSLAPDLARPELVLGFSALAAFRNDEAKAAFERAIELDSADPLAHLGLGLAKISSGDLKQGRGDLEASVALDSSNSLLRSYLGKAYFEERRDPLDGQQLDIAKQLDPNDPTAFLYDGIRKQTINRPVEAVEELEQSIALNDNRAVFRSRLLLDEDRAARGTSLARIYNDLGFVRLGVGESRRSVSLDPASSSAHRFLSDSYRDVRRREIARVSELLQAQMLQDININPVQPSVSETNLNTVTRGGPSSVGFNEFTPLFERNTISLNATGLAGSNDTTAGEAVVSALYNRFSISAGAYHYNTDGWRPNNDLSHEIYNVFAQVAISPELNIQAEFRRRKSTEGDLAFNFDPNDFSENKTIERDQDIARVGLRFSPTPESTILLSYIDSDRKETLEQEEPVDPFTTAAVDTQLDDKGSQWEGQYIFRRDRFNITAGTTFSEVDTDIDESLLITTAFLPFPLLEINDTSKTETELKRVYLYANIDVTEAVVATVGIAYDDYEEDDLNETTVSPKFGVQWLITDGLRVRAAAFKTVKPPLANNRTLEPTQVSGFNQFYDDINGTKSERYGVGFEWNPLSGLSLGGELTWRDLEEPVFRVIQGDYVFEDREEELHRAYLYWTPARRWAVTAELVYDRYGAEAGISTEFDNLPEKVETVSIPMGVRYFHPSGFSAGIGATYVDQEVLRSDSEFTTQASGKDSFFLVDAAVGYRLPKRYGIVSLGIKNMFDEDFYYQDDSYREFRDEPATGPYFPDRTIVGKVSLSF